MRVLSDVRPTDEQLPILQDYRPGFVLIRGAAGSGKTTTAVLRLRHVTGVWANQREREGSDLPVRVLVMTYNRTLRGYVEQLVNEQIELDRFDLKLSTFGHWGWDTLGEPSIVGFTQQSTKPAQLGAALGYRHDFLLDEVDYVLGRYLPETIGEYFEDPSAASREAAPSYGGGVVKGVALIAPLFAAGVLLVAGMWLRLRRRVASSYIASLDSPDSVEA